MYRRWFGVILAIVVCAHASAQFYENLPREQRQVLAEAYYLAGVQYQLSGKVSKGDEFIRMAYLINPELLPGQIDPLTVPSVNELLERYQIPPLHEFPQAPTEELVRFRFLRMVAAFTSQDTARVVSGIDGSVYISILAREAPRSEAIIALETVFQLGRDTNTPIGRIYELGSIAIVPADQDISEAFGETFLLTVRSPADFSANLEFWQPQQQFYFHQTARGEWVMYAIGPEAPPSDWRPANAVSVAVPEAIVTRPPRDEIAEVRGAFLSLIEAMLDKDVPSAIEYLSNVITVRDRDSIQEISRSTIQRDMTSIFEITPYSGLQTAEVVAIERLSVEGYEEGSFLVNVSFLEPAERALPLVTAFARFQFALQDGIWKIFSIS